MDAKGHGRAFESITAATSASASLATGDVEVTVRLWRVTASFLPTLGVPVVAGRDFLAEEDQPGGRKVALLANTFWRARFKGDPRVPGTPVKLDGEAFEVVGILPPGFHVDGRPADVYVPLARSLNAQGWLETSIYARLKPGVTLEQAQAQMDPHSARLEAGPLGWKARPWLLRDFEVRDVRLNLWVLLGAVGNLEWRRAMTASRLALSGVSVSLCSTLTRNASGIGPESQARMSRSASSPSRPQWRKRSRAAPRLRQLRRGPSVIGWTVCFLLIAVIVFAVVQLRARYTVALRSPVRIRFQWPWVVSARMASEDAAQAEADQKRTLTAYQQYACRKFGPACRIALAIQRAENAQGACEVWHYNTDGTLDWGYFQINTVHLTRPGLNLRDLLDCKANIDFAYELYLERGFQPWSTYNSGAYRKFMRGD